MPEELTYNATSQEDPLVVHEFWENEHVIPEGAEQEKVTVVEMLLGLFKLANTVVVDVPPGQFVLLGGNIWTDEIETDWEYTNLDIKITINPNINIFNNFIFYYRFFYL